MDSLTGAVWIADIFTPRPMWSTFYKCNHVKMDGWTRTKDRHVWSVSSLSPSPISELKMGGNGSLSEEQRC